MIRLWTKRRWVQFVLAIVALVVVPYLFSRVASTWRGVTTYHDASFAESRPFDGELRIVSYNIAHGRGLATSNWEGGNRSERSSRLRDIADLLTELDADLVVLNEVDFDASWSGHVNQAEVLALRAKYPYRVEQRNLDFRVLGWTWRFGNALLSKHPIRRAQLIDLPGYSTWETLLVGKKCAVACELRCGDTEVCVLGAHLSHRSEALRVESAQILQEVLDKKSMPTIVAGDLNSTPPGFPNSKSDVQGRNAIITLDERGALQRTPRSSAPAAEFLTFPSNNPNQVIDWILIPRAWTYAHYRSISTELSDHRPVIAEIEFRAQGQQESERSDE